MNISPAPGSRKTKLSGIILISAAATSQTATIIPVDIPKGDLRLMGFRSTGGAGLASTDYPTLEHTNSTTITAQRQSTASGQAVAVGWELTVYY